MSLGILGCTRGNPSFGDDGEGASEDVGSGETSAGTITTGATGSASGTGQTSADGTAGESGETGTTTMCGNGVVEGDEECDKGAEKNSNVGPCKVDCTLNVCGDGYVGPQEACDQPEDVNQEFCTHDCTFPTCGNGMIDRPEECDPTMPDASSECTPLCTINFCGDMNPFGDEECDDGNMETDDGCIQCVAAFCGDGFVRLGDEECDGNTLAGAVCDFAGEISCTKNCMLDTSQCHHCGDGVLDDAEGEQCDPADPNGPAVEGTSCATLNWMGDGEVSCDESCQIGVSGDCCVLNAQPCVPNVNGGFCCSQFCDEGTGMCAGG